MTVILAVVPLGARRLSFPGSSLRLRCGENDSQREAATQEPPSCASRQDTGHAEVAAALRHPRLTSGTTLSHYCGDDKQQEGVSGYLIDPDKTVIKSYASSDIQTCNDMCH